MTGIGPGMVALCCGAALAGCGSAAIRPPAPPVRLSVEAPNGQVTTLAGAIAVRGTVSPVHATVRVEGRPATVERGSFTASVSLAPGMNMIDVLAGSPRTAGAMTALRVYRELPVTVPDLAGLDPSSAVAQLNRRGLRAKIVDRGGFFQSLIPTARQVCGTSPAAGRSLAPGSRVEVQVAKLC